MSTNIERVDLGEARSLESLGFAVSPSAQHPICITAASYDGRMALYLLYDELTIGADRAAAIGDALITPLCAAAGRA
jgi:hypothetical protein